MPTKNRKAMPPAENNGWPRTCQTCTWGHPEGWKIRCDLYSKDLPRNHLACENWQKLDTKRERT